MAHAAESLSTAGPHGTNSPASTSSALTRQEPGTQGPFDESMHIFTVAARSLGDCAELLKTLKAAIAVEEFNERDQFKEHGRNGTTTNGAIYAVGTEEKECEAVHTPPASPGRPQAITPCTRREMYTKPSRLACEGTIGKHVRHLHDHFRLLLSTYPPCQGLSPTHQWSVDYDKRSREVPMETDMEYAIEELQALKTLFEQSASHHHHHQQQQQNQQQTPSDLLQPLALHATIDPSHPPVAFQTTFGRELWFCSLHAVHHFAMIKVICSEFGMSVTEGFGLAPSTVKSRMVEQLDVKS